MEEEYQNRLLSQLSIFEKYSREWEWSDLIKWLSGLKQIIDKYAIPVPADQLSTLSKRLGQCLSPSLPHGLHSKALEIYSTLLQTSSIYQISILSTGLFPHFQFCAPQNKPQYLDLIRQSFLDRYSSTRFLFKGLLSSLLVGANETPDTFSKVSEVLDRCEAFDALLLYQTIWWFVLKSQSHRLAGLQFMIKKKDSITDPVLIQCALLEALNDEVVVNRRNALDYIRNNYQIDKKNDGLVNIAQGVLRLLKSKDHTILRRIWEWIFPNDFDENLAGYVEDVIRPALLKVFHENHEKILESDGDEVKNESIKIIENLCDHELIGGIISKVVTIDVVRHTVEDELFWVNGKIDNRVKNVICANGPEMFWNALQKDFDDMIESDQDMMIRIMAYGKQIFDQGTKVPSYIVTRVFCSLPVLRDLPLALDLLISFHENLKTLEIEASDLSSILSLFKSQFRNQSLETIKKFGILFSKLTSFSIKSSETHTIIKKTLKRKFKLGILCAVKFQSILNHDIIYSMWLEFDLNAKEENELMLEAFSQNHKDWNVATSMFLLGNDSNLIQESSKKFIKFWDYMNKQHPHLLHSISKHTKIIYTMVEQLNSEDPVSRLMAKEWLDTAKVHIGNVLDPVLKILFKQSKERDLNSDGSYQFQSGFDSNVVEKSLKFVYLILQCGGKEVILKMEQEGITDYCRGKCVKVSFEKSSYLNLLIQLALSYLQTLVNPQYLGSPTRYNPLLLVSNIQDISSDILMLITRFSSKSKSEFTLSQISEIFYKFINIKTRLDIYLLQVVESMFSCNSPDFIFPSAFADCLVLGLRKASKRVRLKWSKIITMVLPKIMTSLSQADLKSYLQSIFETYFEVMIKLKDFSLIEGLVHHINTCLNINTKESINIYTQTAKHIVKLQTSQVAKLTFVYFLEGLKEMNLINQLVIPIKSVFTSKFVKSVFKLWKSYVIPKAQARETEIILMMIPTLQITAEEIIEILSKSMEKNKNPQEEIHICNFCQQILMNLEKFKIPVTNTLLWTRVLGLLRRLQLNEQKESLITSINILFTTTKKVPIDTKVLKEIQEIVKFLLIDQYSNLSSCKELALNSYYNSIESVQESISYKYLKSINERGYILFDLIWSSKQEKDKIYCLVTFVNSLFLSLSSISDGAEIVSDLIHYFILNQGHALCEGIKKTLFEFLKLNLIKFINKCPKSVKSWKIITNRAALTFYAEKSSLLLELMYEFEPGILSSFWSNASIIKNLYESTSLMCFIIFSGSKSMYSKLLQGITEKVKEILKHDENFLLMKVLILLCKVLFIKLGFDDFKKVWDLAWPCLNSYFAKYLEKVCLRNTFEVLKFFDFALATNFNELCGLGYFFIDLPEFSIAQENTCDFQPVCMGFLKGFVAKQSRSVKDVYNPTTIREKKLILSGKKPENEEDIENYGKSLIQYSSCYSSEYLNTDWNSIESDIEKELLELG